MNNILYCHDCPFSVIIKGELSVFPMCYHPKFSFPNGEPSTIITPLGLAPIGCPIFQDWTVAKQRLKEYPH